MGSFIRVADNFRGGNVGVQQRGEITKRIGDAPGKLSSDGDCHGAERGDFQRESNAGSEIARGRVHALNDAARFRRSREFTQTRCQICGPGILPDV
jgi:hypothetical protein